MSRRRGNQTPHRSPWPMLGLLLVGLFLGHDALMASQAVAHARQPIGALHYATASHDLIESSAPGSQHPENCSISQPVIMRSTNDAPGAESAPPDIVEIGVPTTLAVGRAADFLWEEPHWPPGTLRAFFQVYRI